MKKIFLGVCALLFIFAVGQFFIYSAIYIATALTAHFNLSFFYFILFTVGIIIFLTFLFALLINVVINNATE